MVDIVHHLRGRHIVYVLECEESEGRPYRYVGSSTNVEKRLCEHLGLKKGGASWCALHKPVSVIECRVCNTKEEAAAMEVMLATIHMSQIGFQNCAGGRLNMPGDKKKKPPHFDNVEYYTTSPRSDKTEKSASSIDETVQKLPPMYHVLAPKDEDGQITEAPPKECLKFQNPKDPDNRLGILAGLVLH